MASWNIALLLLESGLQAWLGFSGGGFRDVWALGLRDLGEDLGLSRFCCVGFRSWDRSRVLPLGIEGMAAPGSL